MEIVGKRHRSVRKNVDLGPPCEVKFCAHRQEVETGLSHVQTAFTLETLDQHVAQCMKVQDIGRGIIQLCFGQVRGTPVRSASSVKAAIDTQTHCESSST